MNLIVIVCTIFALVIYLSWMAAPVVFALILWYVFSFGMLVSNLPNYITTPSAQLNIGITNVFAFFYTDPFIYKILVISRPFIIITHNALLSPILLQVSSINVLQLLIWLKGWLVISIYLSSLSVVHQSNVPRRWLVVTGDSARIQDETTESFALFFNTVTRDLGLMSHPIDY